MTAPPPPLFFPPRLFAPAPLRHHPPLTTTPALSQAGGMIAEDLLPARVPAPDAGRLMSRLQQLPLEDRALARAFALESRCSSHFMLLVGVATEAKLAREQVRLDPLHTFRGHSSPAIKCAPLAPSAGTAAGAATLVSFFPLSLF